MAYLDVISLATAKEYLKVDSGFTDDDAQITRMIKSALKRIEDQTGHVADQRNKTYWVNDREALIFDYPINAVVSPAAGEFTAYSSYTHTCYELVDPEEDTITLNVGYADSDDYPDELIDVALEMIDVMYYANSKDGKKDISPLAKAALQQHQRFLI